MSNSHIIQGERERERERTRTQMYAELEDVCQGKHRTSVHSSCEL